MAALDHDPEARAEEVVRSGKPYLLGVAGYGLSVPGADDESVRRIGYRVMPGTSDVIDGDLCRAYQERAAEYAERFNRKVVMLASQQP
jgi:hypothetical protein